MTDVNQLWVTVSCFGEGNVFALYPKILAKMLENIQDVAKGPPDFELLLPSNTEWQSKIYHQLVEKQRTLTGMPPQKYFINRPRSAGSWDTTVPQPPTKRPKKCIPGSGSISSRGSVSSSISPVTWIVSDIAKAAKLIMIPPENVVFLDEQEMRRVYTLIYDVFRYKSVLNQALENVAFFYLFPELRPVSKHVWLLLYDLYHRRFLEREFADGSANLAETLFPSAGLMSAEVALWSTRIRLAAAMSRLRIAHSALRLSDMLPKHLRDEKLVNAVENAPVMCWVNKNRITDKKSPRDVFTEIKKKLELHILNSDTATLGPFDFRWDPLCPMFISFHHTQRSYIAQSSFVRDNILVMQNRSFCFGPAIFCKLLYKHNLTGSVIQSHISSPRATAYFATLLAENDQIKNLVTFGAGSRKEEYEKYFATLKIKNISVHVESLVDMNPESHIFDSICAVFVTPPNSYSAVTDPIDLVCSRGGDLAMLEILTETQNSAGSQKRISAILEQQRLTLRYAMSRPQFQYVLYETHSQLRAENEEMVSQVLEEVNKAAQYKHAELQGKISLNTIKTDNTQIKTEINNNKMNMHKMEYPIKQNEKNDGGDMSQTTNKEEIINNIELPATDIFEQHKLPELCFNADQCLNLGHEGCYLALCERKEITRFDAKYMIKIAESRGLFGAAESDKKLKQKIKVKKEAAVPIQAPQKHKRVPFETERICAHTHASMMRSNIFENGVRISCCPRHQLEEEPVQIPPARLWWAETARYLTRLKKSLIRQKMLSDKPSFRNASNCAKINQDICNIDEILNCVDYKHKSVVPTFPRLRLTRSTNKIKRKPFPVNIKSIELVREDLDDNFFF